MSQAARGSRDDSTLLLPGFPFTIEHGCVQCFLVLQRILDHLGMFREDFDRRSQID